MIAYRLWLPYQLKINHLFWHRNYFVGNYSPSKICFGNYSSNWEFMPNSTVLLHFFGIYMATVHILWIQWNAIFRIEYYSTLECNVFLWLRLHRLYSIIIAIRILHKIMNAFWLKNWKAWRILWCFKMI